MTNTTLLREILDLRQELADAEKTYILKHSKRIAGLLDFPGCTQVLNPQLRHRGEYINIVALLNEDGKCTHYHIISEDEDSSLSAEDFSLFEDSKEILDEDIQNHITTIYVTEILDLDDCFYEEIYA